MTLDGGARLAATAWITPRPVVVIRRHRLRQVRLAELVQRQMLSPLAAGVLAAAIRARRSVVVSGPQGAGKTTMVRALAEELPAWERIGTFETEYELLLHELPSRLKPRWPPARRGPARASAASDGRQAGEITLDDCLYDSFRFNLDRQIVGEVRGREVLAMVKAMQSGTGSISTTHAKNARMGAIEKLITCALEAGPQVTLDYAERVVAEHIDLIVQVELDTWSKNLTGRQPVPAALRLRDHRGLSNERGVGYDVHDIFTPNRHGGLRRCPRHLPARRRTCWSAHGFDLALFNQATTR